MEKDKELEANTPPNAKETQEKDAAAQARPNSTRPPRNDQRPSEAKRPSEGKPPRNDQRSSEGKRPSEGKPPRNDQRKDENFGNSKEYRPSQAIGGYYREPMTGGDQWRRRPHRQHQPPREIEGVLSVNQPGWQQHLARQSEQERNTALTMRQQEHTSQALERNRSPKSLRSHEPQGQDPDVVWARFMDDLKRGKLDANGRPKRHDRNDRRRRDDRDGQPRQKQPQKQNAHPSVDPTKVSENTQASEPAEIVALTQTSEPTEIVHPPRPPKLRRVPKRHFPPTHRKKNNKDRKLPHSANRPLPTQCLPSSAPSFRKTRDTCLCRRLLSTKGTT